MIALLASCERPLGGGHHNPPLVRLLANPDAWQGKRVLTAGFLALSAKGDVVTTHWKADSPVVFPADKALKSRVDESYVAVAGLFKVLSTGDLILKDVGDLMVYSDKSDEREF